MKPESSRAAAAAPPESAVESVRLNKLYRGNGARPSHALKDFDLAIPRGSLFGLLGPNGAGKSTFINILAGLVIKTSGTARVWGFDIERDMRMARSAIGVVPQEINYDPFFTPRELLDVQAGLYGVPRAERRSMELLEAVGLADRAEAYVRTLSGGMQRRLLVAKAMVHSPPVLVLDEPTAGVDVELRRQLWDYVRALNRAGTTILLTTHYLDEAQRLCDRIAIIDRGRLIACDTTEALLRRLDHKEMRIRVEQSLNAVPEGLKRFGVELLDPQRLVLRYPPSRMIVGEVLSAVQAAGLGIADVSTEEADLEDIFLQLTRAARAEDAA